MRPRMPIKVETNAIKGPLHEFHVVLFPDIQSTANILNVLPMPFEPGDVLVESLAKVSLTVPQDDPSKLIFPRGPQVADVLPSTKSYS